MGVFSEISKDVYQSSDYQTCLLLTTETLRQEARLRGYAVGLVKGDKYLNFVFAFYPFSTVEICWTRFNFEDPSTCEDAAKYIKVRLNIDVEKRLMRMCFDICDIVRKSFFHKIAGLNKLNYQFSEKNKYRAFEKYLASGSGKKYETVLELLTK